MIVYIPVLIITLAVAIMGITAAAAFFMAEFRNGKTPRQNEVDTLFEVTQCFIKDCPNLIHGQCQAPEVDPLMRKPPPCFRFADGLNSVAGDIAPLPPELQQWLREQNAKLIHLLNEHKLSPQEEDET